MSRWPRADHVVAVMAGVSAEEPRPHLHCEHCGDRFITVVPVRVEMYLAISKEFIREHRLCRPGQPRTSAVTIGVTA